jgi:hypothetical protein
MIVGFSISSGIILINSVFYYKIIL